MAPTEPVRVIGVEVTLRGNMGGVFSMTLNKPPFSTRLEFPKDTYQINVSAVLLHRPQPRAAAATVKDPTEIRGTAVGSSGLRIDIAHEAHQAIDQPCEVSCPQSGERRVGPHACIDCKFDDFVIQICC